MDNKIDPKCEHTRIRLIAAAIGHQQCTKTESTLIPLPGTPKFIAIGTLPAIAKVLMVEPPASIPSSTAPAPQNDELTQLRNRVSELEAARIAYASEFPLTADGDPDVGNIHANIRALKAKAAPAPQQSELSDEWIKDLHDSMFPRVPFDRDKIMANVVSFARAIEREVLAKAAQAAPSAPTDRELKGKTVAGWYVAYCEVSAKLKEAEACIGRYEKLVASKAAPSAKAEPVRYEYRVTGFGGAPTPWRETSKERAEQMIANPQVEEEDKGVVYEVRALYAAPAPSVQAEDVRNQAHRKDAEE